MEEQTAQRIATALEQIALELAGRRAAPAASAAPVTSASPQLPFKPIGGSWLCPEHGTRKDVPGGISARTGRPYSAFTVCGEYGCEQRPSVPVPQRAIPPSQLP